MKRINGTFFRAKNLGLYSQTAHRNEVFCKTFAPVKAARDSVLGVFSLFGHLFHGKPHRPPPPGT